MKRSVCAGFDKFVKDFYEFAGRQLPDLRGVESPLTRVLVCEDDEAWEETLRFVQRLSGMEDGFADDADAVWWMMPETREERLALGPNVLGDAWVDYDAYIALHEAKFVTSGKKLAGLQFYYAMASACIQLAAVSSTNLVGAGRVEHDPQAVELCKQFKDTMPDETFRKSYFP